MSITSNMLYHLDNTNPWGQEDQVESQSVCYVKHLVVLDELETQYQGVKYSGNSVIYPGTY
jgi:hypothetical protein